MLTMFLLLGALLKAPLASSFAPTSTTVFRGISSVSSKKSSLGAFSAANTFFFPGQGAQTVGMAANLPGAKTYFDRASEILGYDLWEKVNQGPKGEELRCRVKGYEDSANSSMTWGEEKKEKKRKGKGNQPQTKQLSLTSLVSLPSLENTFGCRSVKTEELDTTEVSQPAIFVASMAAVEHLKNTNPEAVSSATVACGLSLGEYSALCFADSISFEDGVRITKVRGEAMQAASDAKPSSMVSVIGLDSTKVKLLCEKATEISGEDVRIANYLCKGNYAVSGSKKACDVVCEIAKPEVR